MRTYIKTTSNILVSSTRVCGNGELSNSNKKFKETVLTKDNTELRQHVLDSKTKMLGL